MQVSTSQTSLGRKEQVSLSPQDVRILQALSRYHILSAEQVCRLFYRAGSKTYVQTKLKHFTDMGLCQRLFLPRMARSGSSPFCYTLGRQGLNYLRSEGIEVDHRYRPCEKRENGFLFLSHTLAINDVLISAELLERRVDGIRVETMLHERVLKREPTCVQDGDGKTVVIPDGWVDLRIAGVQQICLALEVDMGSEEQKKFRRKVRALVAWANGPYEERFGTTSLTITVVAKPGVKRQLELLRWTETELVAQGQECYADMFRFIDGSAESVEPEEFFLSPCWLRPFDGQPYASYKPALADYQGTQLLTLST